MSPNRRIKATLLIALFAASALAALPSAQAAVEPVDCGHHLANNIGSSSLAYCLGGIPAPGGPVGLLFTCGPSVGVIVSAAPLVVPLCYNVDPLPASCGGVGAVLTENSNDFEQCFTTGGCGTGVHTSFDSSLNELDHDVCIDATGCGGGLLIDVWSGSSFVAGSTFCAPSVGFCPTPAPSSGWGVTINGSCRPLPYVDVVPCGGPTGNMVIIGTPNTGDLFFTCI